MDIVPDNTGKEPERVLSKEEKVKEAALAFRDLSVANLQLFLFLEEKMKEAAQLCLDIAELLEEEQTQQGNLFEGDNSAN